MGDRAALYRANLHLRTASRILVRLGDFHAENFEQLRARAAVLGWDHFLAPGQAVDLRVTCLKSIDIQDLNSLVRYEALT